MAHNIDMTNGRANIAFIGSRNDIWHKLGQEMQPDMSTDQWAKAAGLDWSAIKVPAMANLSGPEFDHLTGLQCRPVEGDVYVVRSDNGFALGHASDGYQPVQPSQVLGWFEQYISVDSRFKLDVAGSLKGGKIIWATATYNGDISVAGDNHVARLLMTTTFDGSGATINQGTMTRTVCNNTLKAALSDGRAMVKTRHNTKFDSSRVGRELAQIATGFESFKAMGDAMGDMHMANETVAKYFKKLLDIPFDATSDDVSTRKLNQFQELNSAYRSTVAEGTTPETAWSALNAVTRYVDHDRSTRGGDCETESRFLSAQFGSGAAMKSKAVELLTTDEDFKALLSQPFVPSTRAGNDLQSMLAQPFGR